VIAAVATFVILAVFSFKRTVGQAFAHTIACTTAETDARC
jgi:hypothetical protein